MLSRVFWEGPLCRVRMLPLVIFLISAASPTWALVPPRLVAMTLMRLDPPRPGACWFLLLSTTSAPEFASTCRSALIHAPTSCSELAHRSSDMFLLTRLKHCSRGAMEATEDFMALVCFPKYKSVKVAIGKEHSARSSRWLSALGSV